MDFNVRDLALINFDPKSILLPKNLRFLANYFSEKEELIFLNYFYLFRDIVNFSDHTGLIMTKIDLDRLKARYNLLISIKEKAAADFNIELIGQIELGEITLKEIKKNYKKYC